MHKDNYEAYGYRRLWKQLLREGEHVPRCQVQRLMREHAIQGAKRRGRPWRTTTPDPAARALPDLLERDFTAAAPDRRWVADFTYVRCWEGVVFFAFILDVYSRMIVGWQFAAHMRTELVQDALERAVAQRRPGGDVTLVHHSDRGSPVHQRPVRRSARCPRRAGIGRLDRRRLRQRDGRELRRHVQDRAHRRSRVAQPLAA